MICTVKVVFELEIVKLTTLYGENSSSEYAQISSTNKVKMTIKVAYNKEIVKILKLTKIYC